jgi:large conductance mechanosensitive channel
LFIGGIDFGGLSVMVGEAAFNYGNFINAVIKFLIVAWVVFLLVKGVNRLKDAAVKKEEAAPAAPAGPTELDLLKEIAASLKR